MYHAIDCVLCILIQILSSSLLQETPIRGELIPYIPPKQGGNFYQQQQQQQQSQQQQHGPGSGGMMDASQWRPVFLCGDRAYVIEGRVARPAPPELLRQELSKTPLGGDVADQLARKAAAASSSQDHQLHNQNGGKALHRVPILIH